MTDIAVTVIGGYLGAGKTTVLNQVLAGSAERTAVLVNDFGSVNIDAELLEAADENGVVSLSNGCICCSISDGLARALDTIAAFEPRPERLVIEASGVARPGDVAVYAQTPGFRLDSVVVIADAEQVVGQSTDKYVGDVIVEQLAAADLLVLNKIDLVDVQQVETVATWLVGLAPNAAVVPVIQGSVPLSILLATGGRPADRFELSSQDRSPAFEAWSYQTNELFDADKLALYLESAPACVVRVKGIVRTSEMSDRRTILHRVGPRVECYDGGPWADAESTIVAIGRSGELEPGWIGDHFSGAVAG